MGSTNGLSEPISYLGSWETAIMAITTDPTKTISDLEYNFIKSVLIELVHF